MIGDYSIYNYSLAGSRLFNEKLSLFLSIRGQFTDGLSSGAGQEDYLDSAENFSLGGLYGCAPRYPSGEATGAQGQLISMEFRYLLGQSLVYDTPLRLGKSREKKPFIGRSRRI